MNCHASASRFSEQRFEADFRAYVDAQLALFRERMQDGCAPAGAAPEPALAQAG